MKKLHQDQGEDKLDRKHWRGIHDSLIVQGFNWLANGKDACWMNPVAM